jgi:hypothetical protein
MTERKRMTSRFALCVKNEGYPASLELRKLYRVVPDARAARDGQIRIIDESGEDYLFPQEYFVPVSLPRKVETALLRIAQPG